MIEGSFKDRAQADLEIAADRNYCSNGRNIQLATESWQRTFGKKKVIGAIITTYALILFSCSALTLAGSIYRYVKVMQERETDTFYGMAVLVLVISSCALTIITPFCYSFKCRQLLEAKEGQISLNDML